MNRIKVFGILLSIFVPTLASSQEHILPTPEQFQSTLTTCAAGVRIEVDGALRGALGDIYSNSRSEIEAKKFGSSIAPIFLDKVPDVDKAKVYELYVVCIQRILLGEKNFSETPPVVDLPVRVVTSGRLFQLKVKTLLANGSEIIAFDPSARSSDGPDGAAGLNGSLGENGVGGAGGNGSDGKEGVAGGVGLNANEIRIEADELIGTLHIINNGMSGGRGGNGGNGGRGGNGGSGKNGVSGVVDCRSGPGNGGGGGNAGNGGDGGRGGDGGDGGLVIVRVKKVTPGSSISIQSLGGQPGPAGGPGQPGAIGTGGPRGSSPGVCNARGRGPGANGAAANSGGSLGGGRSGRDGRIDVTIAGTSSVATGSFSKSF